jgi:hypothetical protein
MKMVTDRDLGDESRVADGGCIVPYEFVPDERHTTTAGGAASQSQAEHWLVVAQRHSPIIQAAKEWSVARADVTPGSFARLALAEAALQSAVANLRGDDPDRRSDGQAKG